MRKLLLFLILLLSCDSAYSGPTIVRVRWNAVIEADVEGYKIYWGRQSRKYDGCLIKYTGPADTMTVFADSIYGLNDKTLYYFAVTAFDSAHYESDYSDEKTLNYLENIGPGKPRIYDLDLTTVKNQNKPF